MRVYIFNIRLRDVFYDLRLEKGWKTEVILSNLGLRIAAWHMVRSCS